MKKEITAIFLANIACAFADAPTWDNLVSSQPKQSRAEAAHTIINKEERDLIAAGNLDNAWAQFELGARYYWGKNGFSKSYKKALYWWSKLADKGSPIAQNNLGFMYKNGFGCEKNYEKAFEYFKKSVSQQENYSLGLLNLSAMYYTGKGTKKDAKLAFETFSDAVTGMAIRELFAIIFALQNGEDLIALLTKMDIGKPWSEQEILGAFKVFTSIIDTGEVKENDLLQLIADYMSFSQEPFNLSELKKFIKRVLLILNKPVS